MGDEAGGDGGGGRGWGHAWVPMASGRVGGHWQMSSDDPSLDGYQTPTCIQLPVGGMTQMCLDFGLKKTLLFQLE